MNYLFQIDYALKSFKCIIFLWGKVQKDQVLQRCCGLGVNPDILALIYLPGWFNVCEAKLADTPGDMELGGLGPVWSPEDEVEEVQFHRGGQRACIITCFAALQSVNHSRSSREWGQRGQDWEQPEPQLSDASCAAKPPQNHYSMLQHFPSSEQDQEIP